ncbi:S8 family serine peptidase [Mycoplasmopsis agassizii]|uniref:Peptidase S8/S53 domain-containing protein n=1 Tax=Mycoplasmopsis agassizii TaxID=33922 RepID=A0ABX4H6F0_9BACT|nr:S8 family serine peptidase [Mycoplasmopsis agassizii]PAF55476.1 hypothetical protein CJF60_02210 [Mycoplasmopsis agassizii]SMC18939.1 Subtilase family protein [Mycoplasmopsis agassizii]
MKKYKRNLWSLLGLSTASLTAVGALVSVSYSSNSQQNVVDDLKTQKEDTLLSKDKKSLRRKYVEELLKSDSIKDIVSQTSFNYKKPEFVVALSSKKDFQRFLDQGANRVDIVFKSGTDKTKLNIYLEQIEKILENEFETLYGQYTLTFSIAYKDLNDFKKLVLKMSELEFDFNDLLQVNVHETGRSSEEFNIALRNLSLEELLDPRLPDNYYVPKTFWDEYNEDNKKKYQLIGLDYQTLNQERKQAYNNINNGKAEMKVGIIEASPKDAKFSSYVNKELPAFFDSSKITTRSKSRLPFEKLGHADVVAEVIMGRQGINPNVMLFSDITGRWNGWLNSTLNWFLYRGVYIANNSWSEDRSINDEYNSRSEWLDNFLNENEDFIFILSAGNSFYDKKRGSDEWTHEYRYLDNYKLSHNSIIVGGLDSTENIKPYDYTESSKDHSYVTTSVPDSFRPTGYNEKDPMRGTSFAAPTITGIATLLKTNYPGVFKQGSDYLILKSALISGSRVDKSNQSFNSQDGGGLHDVYDRRVGFGRANYNKVKESLLNLKYLRVYADNTNSKKSKTYNYFEAGKKYRVNITWKGQDLFKFNENYDLTDMGVFSYSIPYYAGPLNLKLQVTTPDGKSINSVLIHKETSWSEQIMNTETIEFEAKTSGTYSFDVFYDESEGKSRRRDINVALTYSEI